MRSDTARIDIRLCREKRKQERFLEVRRDVMEDPRDFRPDFNDTGAETTTSPRKLGEVSLVVSLQRARATSFSTALQAAVLIVILGALIALVASSVSRWLLSPITEITQSLSSVSLDDPKPLPPPARFAPLEAYVIRDAIEVMRARIAETNRRIRRYTEDLELEVSATTQDLVDKQRELAKALETAESESRAKTLFIANVSHELRTPLQSIILYTHLVTNRGVPQEVAESMNLILHSSTHLLHLIDQLLDISKSSKGHTFEISPRLLRMQPFLRDLVESVRPVLSANRNTIHLVYDGRPELLHCDPVRLRQCLVNLLHNADKFTSRGTITLEVIEDTAAQECLIEVSDTGVGIPQDRIEKIFEPFVHYAHDPTSTGAGLGLWLTRSIVLAMGGAISVRSQLGRGTSFAIRIPINLSREFSSDEHSDERSNVFQPYIKPLGKPHRVLFAEDQALIREPIVLFLREAGFVVDEASNGEEAIELIRRDPACYDVIVLDHRMPLRSGLDVLTAIRGELSLETPVVVLTANESDELKTSVRQASATLMYKPVEPNRIIEVVGALAEEHRYVTSPT